MKFFNLNEIKKLIEAYHPPIYVVKKQRNEEGVDGRIITYIDKTSYIAEQYKVLRTNLYSLFPEKPLKTLVLTSAQPQEGKTITSCNLAYTLSLDTEKKVLLVDADFRRPSVHRMFGIPRKPGFSDMLEDMADIDKFIERPAVGGLYIIPSGTTKTNPSEMLSSTKLKSTVDKLKAKFNYIIFDTPPVLNVTDASILGALCDAVVFVVKAGVTPKNVIEEAFNMLVSAQAKPKGCILTNVQILFDAYYYLYRYHYYRYAERKDKNSTNHTA